MKGFESYLSSDNPKDQTTLEYLEKWKNGVPDEVIEQFESDTTQKEQYLIQEEGVSNREYRERMGAVADKLYVQQLELELVAAQKRELRKEFLAKSRESLDREPKKPLTPELRGAIEKWLTEAREKGMDELADVFEETLLKEGAY